MKFWRFSAKLTFTWKTHPWFDTQSSQKWWEVTGKLCSPIQSFLLFGIDWVYMVRFSSVFCFCSATVRLSFWQWVQLSPLRNALQTFCALVQLAYNMDRPCPPCWVPTFSFHTSVFQLTLSRITRNSSKFLALENPMIPAGMQKKAVSFLPLKVIYFPGTVQMPQSRKARDLFWPTNDTLSPPS